MLQVVVTVAMTSVTRQDISGCDVDNITTWVTCCGIGDDNDDEKIECYKCNTICYNQWQWLQGGGNKLCNILGYNIYIVLKIKL